MFANGFKINYSKYHHNAMSLSAIAKVSLTKSTLPKNKLSRTKGIDDFNIVPPTCQAPVNKFGHDHTKINSLSCHFSFMDLLDF